MGILKRTLDVAVSGVGLMVLGIPLFLVSVAVYLTSGSPVLFRQTRVGQAGRDFTLYKFRTMTVEAGVEKGSFDAGSARRVTPIGRILRKTKLDELPQLWNVLRGDMSLVGPRPEVRKWVEVYAERWTKVLRVRPGITDPASIKFRNEEELLSASMDPEHTYRQDILPQKLELYEHYANTRTFFGDLAILWRTIKVVITGLF